MLRRSNVVLVLCLLGVTGLASCFSSEPVRPEPDADTSLPEGASPGDDATTPEASPEAAAEVGAPDAGFDAAVADAAPDDAAVADAAPDDAADADAAPDVATVADAAPDVATVADAAPDDATVADAAPDVATVADAAPDVATVADAAPDVADASDAATLCISALFGDHYLRPDGKLFYAGGGGHTPIVDVTATPLLGITEVVQQSDHACGLRSDGTVWCWPTGASGGNGNGDLGNGSFGGTNPGAGVATQVVTNAADAGAPTYLTNVVHLSTASDTAYTFPTCAIRGDRSVWCWGFSTAQGSPPAGLFWGATGSTASVPYAIPIPASPADGGSPPPLLADQIAVADRHACVLSSGKVSCWGANVAGNLANGDVNFNFQPYPLPVVTGLGLPATVDAIGVGYDLTCALAGGSVWCWGTNGWKQIGNPSAPTNFCNLNYCEPVPTPVQASAPDGGSTQVTDGGTNQNPLTGVTSLHVGYQFACALDAAGSISCWGALNGGVTALPLATPYAPATVPYSNVTRLSLYGGDINSGLRYTTASGAYVAGNQLRTAYCQ